MVATPRLSCLSGTGDLFAALFAAALVEGLPTAAALGRAVSGVHGVLEETERRQSYEMALIASTERMLRPDRLFEASTRPGCRTGGARRVLRARPLHGEALKSLSSAQGPAAHAAFA
jgi:hypothetical protein